MSSLKIAKVIVMAALVFTVGSNAKGDSPKAANPTVDADGTVHFPATSIPLSSLSSEDANRNFRDFVLGFTSLAAALPKQRDFNAIRQQLDDRLMRPGVGRLRATFPVDVSSDTIGGVLTDIIEPRAGIAKKNARRVLINLHGGGFSVAAGLGGQMESIPIASLGAIKVITIDYREGPEHRFPAASEDVSAVYRELLKTYPAQNIGIYGCSAGAILAAESVAWFQTHGLPRPGAIGLFGSGALVGAVGADVGDSSYTGSALMGWVRSSDDTKKLLPYFDVPQLSFKDPLVSPVYSPSVLALFPPSLLISGTRDVGLSAVVYTHAQLVKRGIDAELHVWEGAAHCSFAQPVVDPRVPETREAWNVIVKFFDKHLGK
jgi:acetyl esterase/lipase